MKIGLDFDGVVSDCGLLKSEAAKKIYGIDIPPGRFKKEIVIGDGHLTAEQYRELQKTIYGNREVGLLMKPVPGAHEYISRLIMNRHQVSIVTSRDVVELEIAKEWSIQEGFALEFVGVGYGKSKADAAKGMDIYIDDDLDKLEPLVGVVPHLFMFSWGYNEHLDATGVAQRVSSWEEFYRAVCSIKGI